MEQLSNSQARSLLTAEVNSGRFFTVEFTKRSNGKDRVLNGHKNPQPENPSESGLRFDPVEKELVPATDIQVRKSGEDEGFRFVPLEGIKKIKARGKEYEVQS